MLAQFNTVAQVAEILKISTQYTRRLIQKQELRAERLGAQWLIPKDELMNFLEKNESFVEPNDCPRVSKELPSVVALSFFSGAMGLDIGLENVGISTLLACEFNKYCRQTIVRNKPEIALIGDIEDYDAKKILEFANIPKNRNIDVIFGGPPCQAFSTAGKRKGFDDKRGNVFLRFIDLIGELQPTYAVIENVRGLLSAVYAYRGEGAIKGGALGVILDKLTEYGYTTSFNLYNAANFGAPQIRERVVIIAKRGTERVRYLTPTHSEDGRFNLFKWRTLGDALQTLKPGEKLRHIEFPEKRLVYYRLLKEGQNWKNLPLELQKKAMGGSYELGGGKTGFYRRLTYRKPSPTLVTNPAMPATDLAHPTEDRPLSVEEYALIQEFPRDWKICGPILEQYKQLGNAVPIKLGEAIGRAILDDMTGRDTTTPVGFPYSRYKNTDDASWRREFKKRLIENKGEQRARQRLLF